MEDSMSQRSAVCGPANPSRRSLFKAVGAIGLSAAMPKIAESVDAPASRAVPPPAYTFLNGSEAAFIEAAVARLIPGDQQNPGARDAEVPSYIDKALAGVWGQGAGM